MSYLLYLLQFLAVFITTILLLLSWTCLPIGSPVAPSSFCLFLRPTLKKRVPTCAGPFLLHGLPITTWDCEPLPRCPSCWFSFLFHHSSLSHHTTCSIIRSIFRWQVWSTIFSFSVSDHVWAPYNSTGNMQDSRTSLLISSFGICRPV
jgi:hypothetical protein